MAEKVVATKVEQVVSEVAETNINECGCIIKPIEEIITTKQPEVEIAEEKEK